MRISLGRLARRALKPNAIIFGAATCLFGWALVEATRTPAEGVYPRQVDAELICFASSLLLAAACLATRRAFGHLLAVFFSAPLPLLLIFSFFLQPSVTEVSFLSVEHVERWAADLARTPADILLLAALSFAILSSATAATLRQSRPRP